jgi:hypothetical protein
MTRIDFFRKLTRYLLLLLMAFIVMALGKKIVSAKDCTECPGKGICNDKTGCDKY